MGAKVEIQLTFTVGTTAEFELPAGKTAADIDDYGIWDDKLSVIFKDENDWVELGAIKPNDINALDGFDRPVEVNLFDEEGEEIAIKH
ncbi:MAG TPA: hypothetical protein VGJ20_24425 [Xanthobacteraceae bacterium]|jgi:hypothetical protein